MGRAALPARQRVTVRLRVLLARSLQVIRGLALLFNPDTLQTLALLLTCQVLQLRNRNVLLVLIRAREQAHVLLVPRELLRLHWVAIWWQIAIFVYLDMELRALPITTVLHARLVLSGLAQE